MAKRKNNKKWNELIYFCLGLLVLLVGYFTTSANNTSSGMTIIQIVVQVKSWYILLMLAKLMPFILKMVIVI